MDSGSVCLKRWQLDVFQTEFDFWSNIFTFDTALAGLTNSPKSKIDKRIKRNVMILQKENSYPKAKVSILIALL